MVAIVALPSERAATEWYEDVEAVQKDPFGIGQIAGEGRLLGTYKLGGSPATGRIYIELTAAKLDEIRQAGDFGFVWKRTELDKGTAESWRVFFQRRAAVSRVPALVSLLGVFSPAISGGVVVLDGLLQKRDQAAINAAALAELMAPGGEFLHYTTTANESGNPLLYTDLFYHVEVHGSERHYLLYSARHAVKN